MNVDLWALIGLYCVDLLTPGPEMMMVVAIGAQSRLAGVLVTMGVALGSFVYKTISVTGLVAILRAWPSIFGAMRVLSASCFVLMAAALIREAWSSKGVLDRDWGGKSGVAFAAGLANALANPFTAAATLPVVGMTLREGGSAWVGVGISALLVVINVLWNLCLVAASRTAFVQIVVVRPRIRRIVTVMTGGLLVCYGVRFLLM